MESFNQIVKSGHDILPFLDCRAKEQKYQHYNRLSLYLSYFEEYENIIQEVLNDITKDEEEYRKQMKYSQYLEEQEKAKKELERILRNKTLLSERLFL